MYYDIDQNSAYESFKAREKRQEQWLNSEDGLAISNFLDTLYNFEIIKHWLIREDILEDTWGRTEQYWGP